MRILVSAQDPGGAQAVIPVVKELIARGEDVTAVIQGPAETLFDQHGITYEKPEEALAEQVRRIAPDVFLAGTSGDAHSIDKRLFSVLGSTVPSVYVMDFWNNYTTRFLFTENGTPFLPTIICVIDEEMEKEMVRAGFPADHLVRTGNPYFEHFTEGITTEHEDTNRILFISQPLSQLASNEYGYDEFQVLTDVKEILAGLPEKQLVIRLHPRDEQGKYDAFLDERVTLCTIEKIEEDISASHTIVGMFSPVLMQAAFAGKHAISYQPHSDGIENPLGNTIGINCVVHTKQDLSRALQEEHIFEPSSYESQEGATDRVLSTIGKLVT